MKKICVMLILMIFPSLLFASVYETPLSKISAESSPKLTGMTNAYSLKIPISARWNVKSVKLTLAYQNSAQLLPDRSGLVVMFNGYAISQKKLSPMESQGVLEADIPPFLVEQLYNDLSVQVNQRTTDKCQDYNDAGLWTSVDLTKSSIRIEYDMAKITPTLSYASTTLFDPKNLNGNDINIAIQKYDAENIRMAALAASGAALRYGYKKPVFHVSRSIVQGMDNIAVGAASFISAVSKHKAVGSMAISYLPKPDGTYDTTHALIMLTGTDAGQINNALRMFTVMSAPYPDSQTLSVRNIRIPSAGSMKHAMLIEPDKYYRIADLGMKTVTLAGMNSPKSSFTFRLPDDSYIPSNQNMNILLHVAYGAQFGNGSALNVYVNGEFAGAIPLSDANGGQFTGYRISVPSTLIKGGVNKVTFEAAMLPAGNGECQLPSTDNLRLTVFGDSVLQFPVLNKWIEMPRLDLMFTSGYPFNDTPDMSDTAVVLSGFSQEYAEAAVNLLASMAQNKGIAPYGVAIISDANKAKGKNKIFLAMTSALPRQVADKMPTTNSEFKMYTGFSKPEHKNIIERFLLSPSEMYEKIKDTFAKAGIYAGNMLGNRKVAVFETQSDESSDKTYAVISAMSPASLRNGVNAMLTPDVSSQIAGGLSIIDMSQDKPQVYALASDNSYYLGKIGTVSLFDRAISDYPKTFGAIVIIAVFIAAYALLRLLRIYRRRRHMNEK